MLLDRTVNTLELIQCSACGHVELSSVWMSIDNGLPQRCVFRVSGPRDLMMLTPPRVTAHTEVTVLRYVLSLATQHGQQLTPTSSSSTESV